ncbi:DUF3613 domain-containing protein [Variovorax sp. Root411]|uniref:DUF3613 domain-containing protein n=1 Tax=Variovorax sp. Root411 TaxID=1736530 RepID=UPI0006F415FD|nr:DUF3613 domain-containing protein [Variovorax sp. Root411]KQW55871.1 hypothetical protein ASC92_17540 [Variovorax sp. Root411]
MRKETDIHLAALCAISLAVALMVAAPAAAQQPASAKAQDPAATANAQTPRPTPVPPQGREEIARTADAEEFVHGTLQVGDATQGLLAWQRSGEIASATSRPIAGAIANRSYERYLKSFEFPIPEHTSSTVKSSSGSGSGAGSPK